MYRYRSFLGRHKQFSYIAILMGSLTTTAILLGINQQPLGKSNPQASGIAHFTRLDLSDIPSQMKDSRFAMPTFDADKSAQRIPDAKGIDPKDGQVKPLSLWDSWPVTDQDGRVANYHGYRLTIALSAVGKRRDKKGVKMALFAQKIDDKKTDPSSWIYLGYVLNSFTEGTDNPDKTIKKINNEWSGSSVMMNPEDDTIRVFYTGAMTKHGQAQSLSTVRVSVEPKDGSNWDSGLKVNHQKASDHKTVFLGDGKIYQTVNQIKSKNDSFAMRDPHFVAANGHYYLTFEGNTGKKYGDGQVTLNSPEDYGSLESYTSERKKMATNNELGSKAALASGAIGLLELNPDFTVKTVKPPLLMTSSANDITERPDLFFYKNKWYLFTCFQGKSLATTDKRFKDENFLYGYVSTDGIDGPYEKLNKTGLVLGSNTKRNTKKFTYAYTVLPPKDENDDNFTITSFTGDCTFGPTVGLTIKDKETWVQNQKVYDQGALSLGGKHIPASAQHW
ncbi:glycoside hydrolase family 68 protein [Fructobacillus sp. M2-14]|uniref:Glycoside hydrolase family 68 protein n=1 Tax=Fructobacillus broussonetiae TaxID=2713173 RepID=A0ABS5R195_9LACO|nr:glycoside hydrolase family 68 protein [Fructobacillus broussonetiae]MBS9338777.1 glycoside hydrolase family 68 protein [Fructobacillus broussonetiae]